MNRLFVGLDGEMSGGDPRRHRLIEIGLAHEDDVFASRIGWPDCPYDPEALTAIGRTPESISEGPPAAEVDEAAVAWLTSRGAGPRSVVAVGWAVTVFDLPFVAAALPRVLGLLSHHVVELTSVCYTLDGATVPGGSGTAMQEWKKAANEAAERRLANRGTSAAWHSAGYDAAAALEAWRWMREYVRR